MVRNLPAIQETEDDPWVGKIPWRKEWLPTPVFLPGESHGQRSLVDCSLWGHREWDTTRHSTVMERETAISAAKACCAVFKKKVAPGIRDSGIAERR